MSESADPPMRLLMAFQEHCPGGAQSWLVAAPGRDMWAMATIGQAQTVTLFVPDLTARATFNYRTARQRLTVMNRPLPNWARYPAGVLLALQPQAEVLGLQAVLAGGEPAGPRYEYAMGLAMAALWHEIHGIQTTASTLLELVEWVRRDYCEA